MRNKGTSSRNRLKVFITLSLRYLEELVEHLALKYHQTARGLEGIVAKKAKKNTAALLEIFKDISKIVEQNPSNIKKLVELKEFMNSLPAE